MPRRGLLKFSPFSMKTLVFSVGKLIVLLLSLLFSLFSLGNSYWSDVGFFGTDPPWC